MAMEIHNVRLTADDIYYAGLVALGMLSDSDIDLICIYDREFELLTGLRGEPKSPEESLKRTGEIIRKFPEVGPAVDRLNDLTIKLYTTGRDS